MTDIAPVLNELVELDPITIDVAEISDDDDSGDEGDKKTCNSFPFPGLILAMTAKRVDIPHAVNALGARAQTNCLLSDQYRPNNSDDDDESSESDDESDSSDAPASSVSSSGSESGEIDDSSSSDDSDTNDESSSDGDDELCFVTTLGNDWSTGVVVDDGDDMSDASELYDAPPDEQAKLRLSRYSSLKTLQRFLHMPPHVFLNALKQSNQLSVADEAWDVQGDGGWVYQLGVRWFEYQFILQSHAHTTKKDAKGAVVVAFHRAMGAHAEGENMFLAVGNLVAHLIIGQHPSA